MALVVLTACGSASSRSRLIPTATPETTVFVYFTDNNKPLPADPQPVPRSIPASSTVAETLRATLEALLAGPTEGEQQARLSSWFSQDTVGLIEGVSLTDQGTVIVNFKDFSRIIPNASTSAGMSVLLTQLNSTIFQFKEVQSVTYQFAGDCEAFWAWRQSSCEPITRAWWEARETQ